MTNLDRVLDEAMDLPLEQQEMLIQILQNRIIERRRDKIAQDAKLSLSDFKQGKFKAQNAAEAISELRKFIQE